MTTKLTHTPTPWYVENQVEIWKDGGYMFQMPNGGRSLEEREANAAFIVRAVNSHEALLEAVKCADNIQRARDEQAHRSHGAECVYCHAIAQAEGR